MVSTLPYYIAKAPESSVALTDGMMTADIESKRIAKRDEAKSFSFFTLSLLCTSRYLCI